MRAKLKEFSKYLLPFVVGVLIWALITNYTETTSLFRGVANVFGYLFGRFTLGFGMAYVLNFFVVWMERRLRFRRGLAIAASYLLLLGLITWMLVYIIPLIIESVTTIVSVVPTFYTTVQNFLDENTLGLDETMLTYVTDTINQVSQGLFNILKGLLNYDTVFSWVSSGTRFFVDAFTGIMISFYALVEKNSIIHHAKRITQALMRPARAARVMTFSSDANHLFSRYMVGKLMESLIVSVLSLIAYSIFKIPVGPFLAVVAGATNLIPYFGPMLGGIITCLVLLCFDPWSALYAIIIIVVVQTIDGMILGPKVVGEAVGISPLLTISAVTLGGAFGNFLGMFLGVPVVAVFKLLIYDKLVARKIAERTDGTAGGHSPPLESEGVSFGSAADDSAGMDADEDTADGHSPLPQDTSAEED